MPETRTISGERDYRNDQFTPKIMPPPPPPPTQPAHLSTSAGQPSQLQPKPRIVLYAQTHHHPNEATDSKEQEPHSLLPLITNKCGVTYVIIAAVHINESPSDLTLNDDSPDDPRFATLWGEVKWLQGTGVRVMALLGGAAKGSFWRLGGDDAGFEIYYGPLLAFLKKHSLDGLDLDIEEEVPLSTPLRLLRRLRADLGPDFILTLAPVATALLESLHYPPPPPTTLLSKTMSMLSNLLPHAPGHLSGFSYADLEREAGSLISWYNVQFYNGWGDASATHWFDTIVRLRGWPAHKVVLGVLTAARHGGSGHVPLEKLAEVMRQLKGSYGDQFGGVMGWEYWESDIEGAALEAQQSSGAPHAWQWAKSIDLALKSQPLQGDPASSAAVGDEAHLPPAQVPWPEENVAFLVEMGIDRTQAIAAMNMTSGDVEAAATILFDDG